MAPATDDAAFLDEVADLAGAHDLAPRRERYAADDRLRVPEEIVSWTDRGPVTVRLPSLG